jgi:hypothetical protein
LDLSDLERRGHELIAARKPVYATVRRLQDDAIERGLHDLAVAYGWSALRIGQEAIDEAERETKR